MRRLALTLVLACSSPPPPRPAPPPVVAAPVPSGPSWVGVRVDPETARITQVIKDAPADRGGLRIGDRVTGIDGIPISTGPAFVERIRGTRTGDTLAIAVVRDGQPRTLRVTVAARPDSIAESALLGKPAPAFEAARLSGPFSTKLADLRGHVVIVDFWATWCGPCAMTIPRLKELHAHHAELRIVGLSSEEPDVIRAFVERAQMGYTIGHDTGEQIASAYLREGIPMFVVIDKAGVVRDVIVGADMDAVDAAVARLL